MMSHKQNDTYNEHIYENKGDQMRTLTKRQKLDRNVKEYILGAIDAQGYNIEPLPTTDKEKLQFLYNTFISEYGWAIERYGEQRAFMEWIQGLPTCFGIDFENYRILQIADKWESITERFTAEKVINNWFNFITVRTFQLFRKHKVN